MKWPILGIMVLFCLQLGFTAYVAIDRQSEALLAANEVTSDMDPLTKTADIYDAPRYFDLDAYQDPNAANSEEVAISRSYRRKNTDPAETILASSKKVVKAPLSRTVRAVPQSVAAQKPFESITISYPRVIPACNESENYQSSTRAIPQSEKRSFVLKSVSVLKKPYGWLKALGSRIM